MIVATISFGMGIDKASVRFVAHWNLSKNMSAFCQVHYYSYFVVVVVDLFCLFVHIYIYFEKTLTSI